MKTLITAIICLLSCTMLYAQTKFLVGGWNINKKGDTTQISSTSLTKNKIYRISSTSLDLHDAKFVVIVDGVVEPFEFSEGSSIFVQGKAISIKQMEDGEIQFGKWEVVNNDVTYKSNLTWRGDANKRILVSSFKSTKEFVLSLNLSSTGCGSQAKMRIWINGMPVLNDLGYEQLFNQGSSFYGVGKKIEVQVDGSCSSDNAFYGALSFR